MKFHGDACEKISCKILFARNSLFNISKDFNSEEILNEVIATRS